MYVDELPNKKERLEQRTISCSSTDLIKSSRYAGIYSLRFRTVDHTPILEISLSFLLSTRKIYFSFISN